MSNLEKGDYVAFHVEKSLNVILSGIKVAKVVRTYKTDSYSSSTRVEVECVEGFGTGRRYTSGDYRNKHLNQPFEIRPGIKFTVDSRACHKIFEYQPSIPASQKPVSPTGISFVSGGNLPPLTFPQQNNLLTILALTA